MGVARGRGDHPVTEHVADHRQALAEREGAGREAAVRNRPAACGWAWTTALVAVLALAGCAGEAYTASPGDPDKPARACLAVDEATPLAMSPADRAACEGTMRGWYAENWYKRPDPADRYTGEAQLDYLRAKALECRRAADAYRLTGKERWTALMRCLVIVRTR